MTEKHFHGISVFSKDIEGRINDIIIARDAEIEAVKKQFDRVLEGNMGLTVVTGKPGVGKTVLIEHAFGFLNDSNNTFIYGKFRQHEKSSFIAVSEIIEQTVRHILTLPSQSLAHIKNDLVKTLGSDAAIIISLCPFAKNILGEHKQLNTDNLEQLKYRVRRSVYDYLLIVSQALFPLVVFIDDLQWADNLSFNLIETICRDDKYINFQLILSSRVDRDGKPPEKLAKFKKKGSLFIELHELTFSDSDSYVQLIFGPNTENRDYLVRILYGLSLGNPFYLNRIIRLFLQEKILSRSADGNQWIAEFSKINNLKLPAEVEYVVINQINQLDDEDKKLLELIVCFEGKTEYDILKKLTGSEDTFLDVQLDRLCRASLLLKTVRNKQSGECVSYNVIHDIVAKVIYGNIEENKKTGIHFRIAHAINDDKNETLAEDKNELFLATQLLKAESQQLKDNPGEWANILYRAGITAKQAGTVEQAQVIFDLCADLLTPAAAADNTGLEMNVRLELGECRFISGETEEARRIFDELKTNYPDPENLVTIKRKYINLFASGGDFEKVIETGTEILAQLNFKLNPGLAVFDGVKSKLLFSHKKINQLRDAPIITDQRLLYILETLTAMLPSANRINDKAAAAISLKIAILSAKYGNSAYSPVAYTAYCYVLFHILKDYKKGNKLEAVTMELLRQSEKASSKSIAYCIMGAFISHWTHPLQVALDQLKKSIEEGAGEGEFLFSSYAVTFLVITAYVMGKPLSEIKQYIDGYYTKQQRPEDYLTICIFDVYTDQIHQLKKGLPVENKRVKEDNAGKEMFADTIELNSDMIKLHRLYLEGNYEEAYRLTEKIAPRVNRHKGFLLNVDYTFYSLLTRMAVHKDLPKEGKRRNRKIIRKYLNELKRWVEIYKDNHYAKYLLARAEYETHLGEEGSPEKLYHEAIAFAEEQGNLPLAALANHLTAVYYKYDGKLSRFYGKEAVNYYNRWGAVNIAKITAETLGLEFQAEQTPEPISEPAKLKKEIVTDTAESKEDVFLFHLGKVEKMAEDEGYLYMLDIIIEKDYADYGAVFI